MLSIAIFTFDPQRFDEVIERRKQEKASAGSRTSILGEWCNTRKGRIVRLIGDGGPKEILAAYRMWSDLGTLEIFPVIDTRILINR